MDIIKASPSSGIYFPAYPLNEISPFESPLRVIDDSCLICQSISKEFSMEGSTSCKRTVFIKLTFTFLVCLFTFFHLTKLYLFDNYKRKLSYPNFREYIAMKAVYPGSFDPITNGHVDIIHRGLKIFEQIVIAVLENPKKTLLFSTKERVDMIRNIFPDLKKIEVKTFHGLLVDFAKDNQAKIVMRGLRAISDFEYEFQMTLMNRNLDPEIETFFMMPSVHYSFLSSRLVKEVCMLGGSLEGLVPQEVESKLREKFESNPNNIFI